MPRALTVISIGGSIVVPKTGIDVAYLKNFRACIRGLVAQRRRFIIVVGGGHTARAYQQAAAAIVRHAHDLSSSKVVKLNPEDVDWLGIHATRLNGQLLRALFRDIALHRVIKDPTKPVHWAEPILIAAGWKPGWSTDYVAVRLARKFKTKHIVNLTNIDAVYDKDPSRFDDAEPYDALAWSDFRKLVGDKWSPGMNAPFDPIASKLAQKWGMEVTIAAGKDLKNLKNILTGKKFKGTRIA